MNEQTPNPNATNEGKNEQAAVSSLPVSPESKPEVVTEVQPEVQKKRTRRRQTNVNKSSMRQSRPCR